jgi:hypothetical protein
MYFLIKKKLTGKKSITCVGHGRVRENSIIEDERSNNFYNNC